MIKNKDFEQKKEWTPAPLFKKDQEINCPKCKSLIAVFTRDCFSGEVIAESIFHPDKGQGPWKVHDLMECRTKGCNFNWVEVLIKPWKFK